MLINSPNISGSLTVTGNTTISGSLTVAGGINATITGSATTASYVEYSNVANKPTLVSGSEQITYSGLSGIPSGIVSSSTQITGYNVFATTGSNQFDGSQAITGSLTVTGQVVAQTLNVQQVTSSIVFSSGSNIFGNDLGNTQQFTGSVSVTGSLTVNGALTGTSATFRVSADRNLTTRFDTNIVLSAQSDTASPESLRIYADTFRLFTATTAGGLTERLTISNTGIATFSSSVTIQGGNSLIINNAANTRSGFLRTSGEGTELSSFAGAGEPLILIAPDTTANIRFYTAGSTSGNERMRITSDGNVGIGTTDPQSRFDVLGSGDTVLNSRGNLFVSSGGTATQVAGRGGQISFGAWLNGDLSKPYPLGVIKGISESSTTNFNSGALIFGTMNLDTTVIERMRITSDSNIRLTSNNASNASFDLNYRFSTPDSARIRFSTTTSFNLNEPGELSFWTRANDAQGGGIITERMRITSGGNIGINKSNPDVNSILDVNGQTFVAHLAIYNNNGTPSLGTSPILYSPASGTLAISTNTAERMRINSSGNVGIGADPAYRLHVNFDGCGQYVSQITNQNSSDCGGSSVLILQGGTFNSSDTTSKYISFRRGDGNEIGSVRRNGTSNVVFETSSDYRLKTDLKDFNGLDKVSKIKVYDFKWIDDDQRMEGVMAHELQEVIPYAVGGIKDDIDEDGNILAQGVDYSKIVPVLVKAIQEQQSQIESLKSKIEILEQS
jgi:hypothetical protein